MVCQQQDQFGVEQCALFVTEVTVGVNQQLIEIVARREIAMVAMIGLMEVGLSAAAWRSPDQRVADVAGRRCTAA